MSLRKYISSKLPFLILNIIAFIFCAVIMTISSFNFSFILFVACIWFMPTLIFIFLDFFSKKKFYDQMVEITEKLDKKYLLPNIVENGDYPTLLLLREGACYWRNQWIITREDMKLVVDAPADVNTPAELEEARKYIK